MQKTTTTPHVVRLRTGVVDRAALDHGIRFRSELCRRANVSRSNFERVIKRRGEPGAAFIAGLLVALPRARFEDLFEVVPVGAQP